MKQKLEAIIAEIQALVDLKGSDARYYQALVKAKACHLHLTNIAADAQAAAEAEAKPKAKAE